MKISLIFLCLTTIIILSLSTISHACDGSHIGSTAGTIYLEEKVDSIQMIKERVTIVLGEDSLSHVKCTFWLVNQGSGKDITVCFPNNFYYYRFEKIVPIRNFTCKVNGFQPYIGEVTLETKYKGSPLRDEGRQWYKWKMHIDEKDTAKIENEYDGSWSITPCEYYYMYTIGGTDTTTTWAGPIIDGRVTFDHSNLVSTNFVIKAPEVTNKLKIKPVYFDDSVVYSFTNYTPVPREALAIWIYSTSFFKDYSEPYPCYMKYIESADNAEKVRNEFYALHGYKFTDPDLFKYYSKKKWYKVNPAFDTSRFSNGERKVIERLNEVEEEFRKKIEATKKLP